jgi:ribonuclease P/MRP protein subunit POP1
MQKKDAYNAALINKDELKSLFESWPHGAQDSTIWEEEIRDELLKARPSIGEINKRREKNVIPGTTLEPLESDVKVPILLIRRNVLGNHENSEATGGWDLIAPKGWCLPLWNLFIFAGARVGGLRDRNHILFEYGVPSYPDDYPETDSFINEKLSQSISSLEKYRRTPRAKRIDYIKKGVKSPFKQPFNDLIGEVQFGKLNLFHSSRTKSILQKCLNEDFKSFEEFSDALIQQINTLIMNKNLFFKNMITKNMNKMFCRVRLTLSSGKAESNAKIYLGSGGESDFDLVFIMLIKDSDIDEKLIIGYTTSGGYSHAAGQSAAIGTCSLNGLYKLFCKQNPIVLLRNRAGRKSHQCDLQLLE